MKLPPPSVMVTKRRIDSDRRRFEYVFTKGMSSRCIVRGLPDGQFEMLPIGLDVREVGGRSEILLAAYAFAEGAK